MTKQDILDQVAREIGDEDSTFKSTVLSSAFNFVLLELAQQDCLSLTRKQSSFTFDDPACVASDGVLNINTRTLLSLAAGIFPERVTKILVPAWGLSEGLLVKTDEPEFEYHWLSFGVEHTGRPRLWRVYPSLAQVQVWPAPDTESETATAFLEWRASPATLADGADITEILPSDLPTIKAGLYRLGIKFREETFQDINDANLMWIGGMNAMRSRITKASHEGRRVSIKARWY